MFETNLIITAPSLKLDWGSHDSKFIHCLAGSEVCCAVCSSEVLGKPGIVSCSDSACVSNLGTRVHHLKSNVDPTKMIQVAGGI